MEVVGNILDSPTEEDQEVLFYMTRDDEVRRKHNLSPFYSVVMFGFTCYSFQTGSDEWEIPSISSYDSAEEETFHKFMHFEDLPPPPDFLLQEYS